MSEQGSEGGRVSSIAKRLAQLDGALARSQKARAAYFEVERERASAEGDVLFYANLLFTAVNALPDNLRERSDDEGIPDDIAAIIDAAWQIPPGAQERIRARFMELLAAEEPDHPWVRK